MVRRKGRRLRRRIFLPPNTIAFDFAGVASAASKSITPDDLELKLTRAMRPVRATCSVAITGATQLPAFYISIYGTHDKDILTVSRNVVVGSTARTITVNVPRATDFGDYPSAGNTQVIMLSFPNYYNGTITYSGTLWVQFAPHKVASKVALVKEPPIRDEEWEHIRNSRLLRELLLDERIIPSDEPVTSSL